MTTEREITEPVALCRPDGRLNREAVGWSRGPLLDTDRIGHGPYAWGRNKRWEYWCVVTPTHVLAQTVSALDYASLNSLWLLDRATGETVDVTSVTPGSRAVRLPGSARRGPVRATTAKLALAVDERPGHTRLRALSTRVEWDVRADYLDGGQAMAVVVPWSERLFQYTIKDVARPASGWVEVDGNRVEIPTGESWAVLDHGRGRWPYDMTWNWGAGSGIVDGHIVGVQIGGKWTEGTGSTENALFVDGRVHKIGQELDWAYDTGDFASPWRITGERVDLRLVPFFVRSSTTSLGVIASEGHQCFGTFSGHMVDDDGRTVAVRDVTGWVEHVHNRW